MLNLFFVTALLLGMFAFSLPFHCRLHCKSFEIYCSHCVSLETAAGRSQMHTGSAMLPLSITTASVECSAQPGKI
jgi:hypothetical protein